MDDFADRVHRFVALGAALIADQVQLHVGGFAVTALHAGGGDHVAPEVRDVLNMLLVGLELGHQGVVVPVRGVAQRFVADQNDHRDAVGGGLLELLAHPLGGDHSRRILRRHRHRVGHADLFDLGDEQIHRSGDRPPRSG